MGAIWPAWDNPGPPEPLLLRHFQGVRRVVFEGAGSVGPHCHALPIYDLPCEMGVFLAGRLRSPVGLGRARVHFPDTLARTIMSFLYL